MPIDNNKPKPSLLAQWKKKKQQKGTTAASISPRPQDKPIPLSRGQKRLWFLQQLHPQSSFYQYGHCYKIQGKLDKEILTNSFQQLIERHEILRSNYKGTDEGVFMTIQTSFKFEIETFNLSDFTETEQQQKAESIKTTFAKQTFDLKNDLLLRVALVQFSENVYTLLLSIHHIIGDRTSLLVMNEELFSFYENLKNEKDSSLSTLDIQYPDYTFWQNAQTTKTEDINYWTEQLSGELPLLSLPHDFHRPKNASFEGANHSRILPEKLSTDLQRLTKELQTTPYVLLLAAFKVLLFRYTSQSDLLIGSPFDNRDKRALEKLVGFFNETLVLRTQLSPEWTFSELVQNLKKTTLDALAHKSMPFDELVKTIQPERYGSANPIFQVMFLYNKAASINTQVSDFQIEEQTLDIGVSKFDITLFATDKPKHLELTMEYATDLFQEKTIAQLLRHLENILTSVVTQKDLAVAKIAMLEESETKLITEEWNNTSWEQPSYDSIHQRIDEMALQFPNQTAVTFGTDSIAYATLKDRSDQLASVLLEKQKDALKPIGLYTERSINMIVGILAILKTGAPYLPLDPNYPKERISYMLEDAGVELVLSQDDLLEQLGDDTITKVSIEEHLEKNITISTRFPDVTPQHNAYIIYTSGSTGKPKGVPIKHRNLLHSTFARFSFYPENPKAFLLLSSFSFDSSIVGIFWTLASGGKLVLPPKRIEQDLAQLSNIMETEQVSHTLLLPSLYNTILDHAPTEKLKSLRNVMVAGEACPSSLSNNHFTKLPNTQLYNEYGPTEASVWCIAHQITGEEKDFVPIGKAIPNTSAFILDAQLQVVPLGVSGELYIGGAGLSEGYLNRPELTAQKFLPSPFDPSKKIYKTGDLARFHNNGMIEFLGRADHQVKIRGFRVELEEIQEKIMTQQGVTEALVVVYQDSDTSTSKKIIAYVTASESMDWATLKQNLQEILPEYMVPDVFIPLEEFPRLPNGKINRKKLPKPLSNESTFVTEYIAPIGETETKLASIWSAVLKIEKVGRTDNFFSIGGDSILSIQIVSKARAADILLRPNQIFEQQTIVELAADIDQKENIAPPPTELIENPTSYPLSSLQNAFLFNSHSEEQDQGQLLLAFEIKGNLVIDIFKKAWEGSALRHDAMRAFVKTEEWKSATQVIAADVDFDWQVLDWSNSSSEEQENLLNEFRLKATAEPLDLTKFPVSKMTLIKLGDNNNLLIWVCHHLFLDGWSCGIILKDVMELYDNLKNNNNTITNPRPNYLSFLKWKDSQDKTTVEHFWKERLQDFDRPLLFSNNKRTDVGDNKFKDTSVTFSKAETQAIQDFCQKNKITSSGLYQGIWAMLLSQFFQTTDVLFGLTVTGRFADFPQIENISGLFMNILPNRFDLSSNNGFTNWLQTNQKSQGVQNSHDYFSLDEIQNTIEWPAHQALFDSLFVFGNFLKDGLAVGDLSIVDFEGGFSSTYPLTIHINPKPETEIKWRFDNQRLTRATVNWFKEGFTTIVAALPDLKTEETLENVIQKIGRRPHRLSSQTNPLSSSKSTDLLKFSEYAGPRNQTETDLTLLFQNLFNLPQVGIHDNYFDLGGNSLMAIQLFAKIEKELGTVLPPATLFKHPNIAGIASFINNENQTQENSSLVALRKSGDKPPLFCLHGGGGHVFFYQGLTKYLPSNQPVYTIQPSGLDGQEKKHGTIKEMAAHYISILKTVQPEGPYHILGTCFSNAVALEIGHQLLTTGDSIATLFIIDSAPVHLFGDDESGERKTMARFYDMLKRGDFSRIKSKISRRFFPSKPSPNASQIVDTIESKREETASEKNLRLTIDSLNKLYADYHWHPLDTQIHFIRSSEFHQRKDKKYHLTQWNKLAKKGLEVSIVEGHHFTLFEEPEVQGLAKEVGRVLDSSSGES
ncbi:MAG: amino acid adenylation domain-containing protein [Saprospiraceae bacterium]